MTVAMSTAAVRSRAKIGKVTRIGESDDELRIEYTEGDHINSSLTFGANSRGLTALAANEGMCFQGVVPAGNGFKLEDADLAALGLDAARLPSVVRPYVIGSDLVRQPMRRYIIDFFGHTEEQARKEWPLLYQRLLDRVYPERAQNNRASYRDRWWGFAEARPAMRRAISGLRRFIVTPYTAKFRPFVFIGGDTIPDAMAYAIASDDAWHLGVLSSRVHATFARSAGGSLEDRPRYNSNATFAPFPFPEASDAAARRIRDLAEQLDAHRKRQQTTHPQLTLTGMYNVLEKLRAGESLNAKEKVVHEQGLISVLRQLHDELDWAVMDAYGWPVTLEDEQLLQRVVSLNGERAKEEQRGHVRWLRPGYQNPSGTQAARQTEMSDSEATLAVSTSKDSSKWPKDVPAQLAAIKSLFHSPSTNLSADDVCGRFKGARKDKVLQHLASLEGLGLIDRYESTGVIRWHA